MPQVVPFVVSAVAGAFISSPLIVGALTLAASLVVGSYTQRQAAKKARAEYNAAQVDRFANVVATVAPRELVLGRVRKGGSVAFRAPAGQFNSSFYVHLAIAAHEIDAVEEVWFNDQKVTIDSATGQVLDYPYRIGRAASGTATIPAGSLSVVLPYDPLPGVSAVSFENDRATAVTVTVSGRTVSISSAQSVEVSVAYQYTVYTPRAWVWIDTGLPLTGDAETAAAFPGVWTYAHVGNNIAKLICRFDYDDTAFPSGVPAVTAVVRGAKVYDPRTGLTQWSDNPALLARHVYQHAQFGKATVTADEDARFVAAANACDVSQNYVVNGVSDAQKLYRAGTVVPFGTPAASVLDVLCQAMAGMWAFAGGELFIRAGTYTAPVAEFGDSDLAVIQRNGESEQQNRISIAPHRERVQKFNVVNSRIWDAAQGYKQVGLTPLKGTALITRDGQELAQEVEFPAVSYAPQALHVAGVMMRDARDPLTVDVPLKMTAYAVELLDTISLSFSRYGWDSSPKAFIVLGRVWDRMNGVIRLTCKETAAAIFTPDASFDPQGYADNTSIPNPWTIEPPGTLTVSSGTSELMIGADGTIITRVRVSWPEITDQRITTDGQVEVQWCLAQGGSWSSMIVNGNTTVAFITGLSDGVGILVRARTRTSLATSDWGQQQLHVVVGKTDLPSNVSSFAVDRNGLATWTLVADADVSAGGGYVIRWQPGTNISWGDAAPLHDGVLTESPYEVKIRPSGVTTFMLKAVDSSGNESEEAAVSVINLGSPLVENVVTTVDYKALGFPGTIVNATVVGGDLVADVDTVPLGWDANPATAGWTFDTDPGWTASTYKPISYTPDALIVADEDEGAQLTIRHTIECSSYLISYRRDGDALGWTTDAEPGWTADADLAWDAEEFRPWPGTVLARAGRYEFRVTTQSRDVQSVVSELASRLDVPDLIESLGVVQILAGGTVLEPTKSFRAITGINLTLVADGGSGVTARIEDFTTRTVTVRDSSAASVDGSVIATLQGY